MDDRMTLDWHAETASIKKWERDKVDHAATRLGVTPACVTSGMMRSLRLAADETTTPRVGNLLLTQGQNAILSLILGLNSLTLYDNSNAYLGVGDSTTAPLVSQTGLQGGANTAWAAVNASNPAMSAGSTVTTATIEADFGSGVAEWGGGWQEWALGNASNGGRVVNRAVGVIGTGKNTQLWTLSVTIGLGG